LLLACASAFLLLFSVQTQAQRFVQHEVGLQLEGGIGMMPYNEMDEFGPHFGGQFQYNAVVANGHLVFGVGLGYSNRGWTSSLVGTDPQGNDLSFYFTSERKGLLRVPLSIGYRTQFQSPHNLFANAILSPTYLLHYNYQYPLNITADRSASTAADTNRPGMDLGLQVGYRLQLSDEINLQVSATTLYEAVPNSNIDNDRNSNYQLFGLNIGLSYSL
jgi:hypothetical protein